MDSVIRNYMAEIGRVGGKRSKRTLSSAQAKQMVKVREAQKAYRSYHARCFWSYDPTYKIKNEDISWVAEKLKTYGGHEGWELGEKLCR